jgi:ubiquinol-cytochrome c reductase cytochrome b subunit
VSLRNWVEERSGLRSLWRWLADEPVVGGARWAYALGATLLTLVAVQLLTGIGLALWYSPSEAAAWASVWWIEERVWLGSLLRGIHHHGASVAVVVAGLHAAQNFLFGAYKRPRELTWVVGVLLLLLLLGFALTGYLLPWDQRGYWSTKVSTSIAGTSPVVGRELERLAQGGEGYGTATLTRFYALHAVVLPLLFLGLVGVHLALFRRRGATPPPALEARLAAGERLPAEPFWPGQAARDAALAAVAVGAALLLALRSGAPLEAPADASQAPLPRPEWYFLGLFQLLKLFHGPLEPVATLVLPGVAVGLLLALPFLDRSPSRALARRKPWVALFAAGAAGYLGLTAAAVIADARDPAVAAARAEAERVARRARALAANGIPPEGAAFLVANDPPERGRRLFAAECTSCHTVGGRPALPEGAKAPDLAGLFSAAFVAEQIRDPDAPHRFGRTRLKGKMDAYGKRLAPERVALLAGFVHARRDPAAADGPAFEEARGLFRRVGCAECHALEPGVASKGPNLHDYGSDRWLTALLEDPGSPLLFGAHNDMPALRGKLSAADIAALVAHLRTLEALPVASAPRAAMR